MQERLLGFDARDGRPDPSWAGERSRQYLLRDVDRPRSVDVMVWPSMFREGVPVPSWRGPNQELWDDLERMRAHLGAVGLDRQTHQVIAVSWVSRDGFEHEVDGPYLEPMKPESLDAGWRLLGYDVADRWQLSGLSNCGYTVDERDTWRARWGPHLNEHHLFDDLDQAFDFRDASDLRVTEHAPFFVFGLWAM